MRQIEIITNWRPCFEMPFRVGGYGDDGIWIVGGQILPFGYSIVIFLVDTSKPVAYFLVSWICGFDGSLFWEKHGC